MIDIFAMIIIWIVLSITAVTAIVGLFTCVIIYIEEVNKRKGIKWGRQIKGQEIL